MEKRRPHFKLSLVKACIETGAYRVTDTALNYAVRDFGCAGPEDVVQHVLSLEAADFYKSMTTIYDNTLWQDVYRPVLDGVEAYVKVQILEDKTVVISFKAAGET